MSEPIRAYPLQWPAGWRRTAPGMRIRGRFNRKDGTSGYGMVRGLSVIDSVTRVLEQLRHMGVQRDDIVISTNMPTRLDGMPRSNAPQPSDPGAAVYWQRTGEEARCMPIDHYDSVADNLAAIAATLHSMRAIERHGGATILNRAFSGFAALPSPECWWQVLGLSGPDTSRDEIERTYRRLASEHHPDRGGNEDRMARINRARDIGMEATR